MPGARPAGAMLACGFRAALQLLANTRKDGARSESLLLLSTEGVPPPGKPPSGDDASVVTAKMNPLTQAILSARQRMAIVMLAPLTPSAIALTMIPAHTSPRGIIAMATATRVRRFTSER